MFIAVVLRVFHVALVQPSRGFIGRRRRARLIREMDELPRYVQRDIGWPPREETRR